ncbi:unnamed protein product [Polarella glacialis]|uniref:non-specific serine/threonine protein kinase n=1 Tax=Polarella glacialis TaxID=89957 RepID=A0A813HPM1_POLGL|nr:unnamed protein product [Polarella glacialis]
MQIFVRTPSSSSSSKQISVTVNAQDAVETLKELVSDIGGFPFELLRLTFCSRPLDDSRRVGDYGLTKGDTLQAHLAAIQTPYRPGPDSHGVPVDVTVRFNDHKLLIFKEEAKGRVLAKTRKKERLTFNLKLWDMNRQSWIEGVSSLAFGGVEFRPSLPLPTCTRFRAVVSLVDAGLPDIAVSDWHFETIHKLSLLVVINRDSLAWRLPRRQRHKIEFQFRRPRKRHDLAQLWNQIPQGADFLKHSSPPLVFCQGNRLSWPLTSSSWLQYGAEIIILPTQGLFDRATALAAFCEALAKYLASAGPSQAAVEVAATLLAARSRLAESQESLRARPSHQAVLDRDMARKQLVQAMRASEALAAPLAEAAQRAANAADTLRAATKALALGSNNNINNNINNNNNSVAVTNRAAARIPGRNLAAAAAKALDALNNREAASLFRGSAAQLLEAVHNSRPTNAPGDHPAVAQGLHATAYGCWDQLQPLVVSAKEAALALASAADVSEVAQLSLSFSAAAQELPAAEAALSQTEQIAESLQKLEALLDDLDEAAATVRRQQVELSLQRGAKRRRRLYKTSPSPERNTGQEDGAALAPGQAALRQADKAVHEAMLALAPAVSEFPEVLHVFGTAMPEELMSVFRPQRVIQSYYDNVVTNTTGRHRVLLGTSPDGIRVAVKEFVASSTGTQKRFFHEVSILRRLAHPHVVEVRGVFMGVDGPPAYYVEMPAYPGGSLDTWAEQHRGLPLMRAFLHVASALEHIHGHHVVHRDVKPANIFVDAEGCARLGDFDVAVSQAQRTAVAFTTIAFAGTEGFAAPETLPPSCKCATSASDMFSFGATMAAVGILSGTGLTATAESLMALLCSADPVPRPSAAEARLHPCFAEVQAAALALPRRCCICLDAGFFQADGECCGAAGHFVCRPCLGKHVAADATRDPLARKAREGRVGCPLAPRECSSLFSDGDVARTLSREAFAAYMRQREQLVESRLAREAELEMQSQLKAEVARLRAMDERQRRVHLAVHQLEDLLVLKCPRCSAAFADFEGCCALHCSRCPCKFCAWCFRDCGENSNQAHQHVAGCTEKPQGLLDPLFVEQEAWISFQKTRRRAKVEAALQQIEADVRADVRAAVAAQLRAL